MQDSVPSPRLELPLDPVFTRLAALFSEEAAQSLGLDRRQAMKLALTTEEVFNYLADQAGAGESIILELSGGGYLVELKVLFPSRSLDFSVFNLTARPSLDDEAGLAKLGLLLASRSVERFSILVDSGEQMGLAFFKEKSYPPPGEEPPPATQPLQDFQVVEPSPQQAKDLARLISAHYPSHMYPSSFTIPGKLADMVCLGDYWAVAACDQQGRLGGCLIWRNLGPSLMQSYGPYLFGQPPDSPLAQALVEACVEHLAKSKVVGLIARYPTPELPAEYFEPLGELHYVRSDGTRLPWPHFYRQLKEDPGAQLWAHPDLEEFLEETRRRLFLAREIHYTRPEGEKRPQHSVLGAHMDRGQGHVTLRPLWDGVDIEANLARHLEVLEGEGFATILMLLDLGVPWQSNLVPALLQNHFRPRIILPYGGVSDLLLFQYERQEG